MSEGQKIKELEIKSFKNFSFFEGKISGIISGISDRSENRYSIMSKQQFQLFYKTLKGLFQKGAVGVLSYIGRETGKELLSHLNTIILSDKEAVNYLLLALNKLGWGRFWNTKIESDEITLEVHHSFEAYEEGTPSCYYIKGILEGTGEVYFEAPVYVLEENCIAQKQRMCTYKIIKRDKFNSEWVDRTHFDEVLNEFDAKAKSKASFIISREGKVFVKHVNEDFDADMIAGLDAAILGAAARCCEANKITLSQVVLIGDQGTIMAKGTNDDRAIVAALLNKNASPGLIGIALKQACDKVETLADKYPNF